jgi:hypothetical protein
MPTVIALFGAGGKMGCRITDNLKDAPDFQMLYVEPSESGLTRLRQRGLSPTPYQQAAATADVAVLAVPDALIGKIAPTQVVPFLKKGAMIICLDPAAPFAGVLPPRHDITYFVTHPCHPPVFNDETDPEARRDFFGGVKAKQNIVCALMRGPEEDYARGEAIARRMFAPVMKAHRITVEQMAILEPALSETVAATLLSAIREAMDEAVKAGVPFEAARDFLLGHIRINLGMFFGEIDTPLSDGAKLAVAHASKQLLTPHWKRVFEPAAIRDSIYAITHAEQQARQQ